jgi:large subunit ribosomal protein L1
MEKKDIINAIKYAREQSPKRNFEQSFDLIVTLKDLDIKKPENQLDIFMQLPHSTGKKVKICGLVGPEMVDAAKKELDYVIPADSFDSYGKDKKQVKKLAADYDYFVAQANLMPKVATAFGRVLGPRNKMPNPKSGCIVPPNMNLAVLKQKLATQIRIAAKLAPQFQASIGKEKMSDDVLADNAMAIYTQMVHHLPNEENNIKQVMIKITMGPSVKVGAEAKEKTEVAPKKKK